MTTDAVADEVLLQLRNCDVRGWRKSGQLVVPAQKLDLSETLPDLHPNVLQQIPRELLIRLEWQSIPGSGQPYSIERLDCQGSRLYLEDGADGICILARTRGPASDQTDASFLQQLFASNGKAFGTGVIDGPPHSIVLELGVPRSFLADILWAAFDAANCWDSLLEEHPDVWDEQYEHPDADALASEEVRDRYWGDYLASGGFKARRLMESTTEQNAFGAFVKKRLVPFKPLHKFAHTVERDAPTNKYRILLRYLAQVM